MTKLQTRCHAMRGMGAVLAALGLLGFLCVTPATAGLTKKKALTLFYTKDQCDARFPLASDTYSKSEVYSKTESDAQYPLASDVYTKTESDTMYASRLWATVASNGQLLRGNGTVPGTSKTGTGTYSVKFNQAVNGCAKVATLYDTLGEISVLDDGLDSSRVVVMTGNSSGTATDKQFHLVVIC